ncbi:MAG: hypothetical protein AAF674_05875 [Pseudomonadota bacterium]
MKNRLTAALAMGALALACILVTVQAGQGSNAAPMVVATAN